jgi:hypothetical protein
MATNRVCSRAMRAEPLACVDPVDAEREVSHLDGEPLPSRFGGEAKGHAQ